MQTDEGTLVVARNVWGPGLRKSGSIYSGYLLSNFYRGNDELPSVIFGINLFNKTIPMVEVPVQPGKQVLMASRFVLHSLDFSNPSVVTAHTHSKFLWKRYSQSMSLPVNIDEDSLFHMVEDEVDFAAENGISMDKSKNLVLK